MHNRLLKQQLVLRNGNKGGEGVVTERTDESICENNTNRSQKLRLKLYSCSELRVDRKELKRREWGTKEEKKQW